MMTLLNEFQSKGAINRKEYQDLLLLLYPVSPHVTEELWELIGAQGQLHQQSWPVFDEEKTVEDIIEMAVQINGKVRGKIRIPAKAGQQLAHEAAFQEESILSHVNGKTVVKEVFVPGRIYNIVVK
jgi:leucyl-tRNA synthetase